MGDKEESKDASEQKPQSNIPHSGVQKVSDNIKLINKEYEKLQVGGNKQTLEKVKQRVLNKKKP